MPKGQAYEFNVLKTRRITPHMLRVTLGGPAMATFPADQASAYLKLVFARQGADKPQLRTYTIRHQTAEAIDLDFVIHDGTGPAMDWARNAQPGDRLQVRGPGPAKLADPEADWFLFVGDMTALPPISANLEKLPADAQGHAILQIQDEADKQDLQAPEGLAIEWIINPNPRSNATALVEAVRQVEWRAGHAAVWCACEFSSMKKLRDHFRDERGLGRRDLYISSYWKVDNTEEAHRVVKRRDSEAQEVESN